MNQEQIKGEVGNEKIETGCGCVWCDVGLRPTSHGYHVTARGDFMCTKPVRKSKEALSP